MNSILKQIKNKFHKASIINKLIYANVTIFIFFSLIDVISYLINANVNIFINKFELPSNTDTFIQQPWAIITYMFFHNSFLHLLFNMIWLHFGGKILINYINPKQFLSSYLIGGICGGILFILSYNFIPAFSDIYLSAFALGASASVFAIMIAAATYSPNLVIQLPLFGSIKLKYIAIFMITLDIISIPKGNAGGHIAHIGGAIFGFFYINQLKRGKDYSITLTKIIDVIINTFNKKPKFKKVHKRPKTDYEFNEEKAKQKQEINKILEKISKSGYESLSQKEKDILFSESKK
tara:strand:- start:15591 stop:16469 length:879 start_codon:yes stop_codon:yes gene_type:complete